MENKILINSDCIVIVPNGISKLLSFKRKIQIPWDHVDGATLDKDILKKGLKAFRFGTFLPGFYRGGSFYLKHDKLFLNIKNSSDPVVIQLHGEEFDRLILGVDNPKKIVKEINNRIIM